LCLLGEWEELRAWLREIGWLKLPVVFHVMGCRSGVAVGCVMGWKSASGGCLVLVGRASDLLEEQGKAGVAVRRVVDDGWCKLLQAIVVKVVSCSCLALE